MENKTKLILSIETSCDETAAAVLSYRKTKDMPQTKTLSSVVKSQIKLHSKMGGVVPEAAARAHVKNILPVVEKALGDARKTLEDIDYIAPTVGPGLIPSLIVGTEFAKALSLGTGIPLLPINHMAGHLYSPLGSMEDKGLKMKDIFPQIALIISGGHTLLVLMETAQRYRILGKTVDDAAGEAFDKVAKLLSLPYPGGPEVSKLAAASPPTDIRFPRPMIHTKDYNFSFAGLKTAVLYYLKTVPESEISNLKPEICKAFQDAVIDVLTKKTFRAAEQYRARSISLSGGVSANTALRAAFGSQCQHSQLAFFVPGKGLSTDNAEMIGIAAAFALWQEKKPLPPAKIQADPNLQL